MIDQQVVREFPNEWIEAWNNHDPDRFLSRVSDDFEVWAPATHEVTGESVDILRGKAALADYWDSARRLIPDLHFERVTTLFVRDSVTLYYKGVGGRLAAETFFFDSDFKVCRVLTMLGEFLSIGRASGIRSG